MSSLPTREQCCAAARAALDRARAEAAADYAAGRMTSRRRAAYERARAKYAARITPAADLPAA